MAKPRCPTCGAPARTLRRYVGDDPVPRTVTDAAECPTHGSFLIGARAPLTDDERALAGTITARAYVETADDALENPEAGSRADALAALLKTFGGNPRAALAQDQRRHDPGDARIGSK